MKRGSSGNNRKKNNTRKNQNHQQATPPKRQYPTKDNIYEFPQGGVRRDVPAVSAPKSPERKKRSRKANLMILPMFVFVTVAIYLCGQVIAMSTKKTDVDVETVSMGTIHTPENYTGLIVREEYVATSTRAGQPFYRYAEKENAPKNAVVCQVKNTSSTDVIESKIDEIDKDILRSQKERTDLSAFSEDISRIETSMKKTIDSYSGKAMKTDMTYLYAMKNQVEQSITQRNSIWLTENVESLSQLTAEKTGYEQQLAQNMSAITAANSGVFTLSYDGLEDTLTTDTLSGITKAQIGGKDNTQYLAKASLVAVDDPIFRIVTSNKWYIVAYLPNNMAINWETGRTVALNLKNEDEVISVSTRIDTLERGDKETRIIFSALNHMEEFIDVRNLSFQIKGAAVEGLKVPNSAIVEKFLYKVPKDCIQESGEKSGVLLVSGEKTKFISVTKVTSDEENYYIDKDCDLNLGDVILQGTGEEAINYTVETLDSRPGVYIANSSMAQFIIIEILDQNQEYAIIRSGTNYGLQIYDTIISDAKNISEGQSVY